MQSSPKAYLFDRPTLSLSSQESPRPQGIWQIHSLEVRRSQIYAYRHLRKIHSNILRLKQVHGTFGGNRQTHQSYSLQPAKA